MWKWGHPSCWHTACRGTRRTLRRALRVWTGGHQRSQLQGHCAHWHKAALGYDNVWVRSVTISQPHNVVLMDSFAGVGLFLYDVSNCQIFIVNYSLQAVLTLSAQLLASSFPWIISKLTKSFKLLLIFYCTVCSKLLLTFWKPLESEDYCFPKSLVGLRVCCFLTTSSIADLLLFH